MLSNLNFDIDTESLLLEPIHNFPCFSTAKQSVKLLMDNCDSLVSDCSSVSSDDNYKYDICTPIKTGQKYKDTARDRLSRFGLSVERLTLKRRALKEATDMLRQQVKEFMDVPLVSRGGAAKFELLN